MEDALVVFDLLIWTEGLIVKLEIEFGRGVLIYGCVVDGINLETDDLRDEQLKLGKVVELDVECFLVHLGPYLVDLADELADQRLLGLKRLALLSQDGYGESIQVLNDI